MDQLGQITSMPSRSPAAWHWRLLLTILALLGIVLTGAYFRTLNLSDWDGHTSQHPDERYMHYTVVGLSVPPDWRTYFISTCPEPMPAPRNPYSDLREWEPSKESGCSTLNPRNFNWSRGYVYGTLPTTLTRIVVEVLGRTDTHQIVVTGRALSAGLDLITLLATFFLANLLYDRRIGLLAAALYAGAVMPIQQSHFFTVDNFAVCFGTLALLFVTRLALRGGWLNALLTGLFISAAAASKINMAVLVVLVPVALLIYGWRVLNTKARSSNLVSGQLAQPAAHLMLLLLMTGCVTFAAFRVFQPDAFSGPHIWDIKPEPRFLERLAEARLTASGEVDLPSSHQWADRTPWLFPWQNMVLWGMGAPLGIAAWLGWAAIGTHMVTRRHLHHLLPWFWIALYFGWQGGQFTMTLRYFLPIYPPLIIFGAWGLVRLAEYGWGRRMRLPARFARGTSAAGTFSRVMALGIIALVLGATLLWAWAYTRIYTRPYTRVAAAEWIKQTAPDGTVTTWEVWDDPLPLDSPRYTQLPTHPYAEEEVTKYLHHFDPTAHQEDANGLINQLAQAEYVVLTSPRVYNSVVRVPQRFPATIRYYEALFDGSLGFELAADIHSFPTLGSILINDLAAEEAFWVYDHPRVLIFRRTADFSVGRARQIIIDGVAWGEIYRGLRPAQISQAPNALQLSATAWDKLQSADVRYLFNGRLGMVGSLAAWLLAIELLGLAAVGLLWKLKLPLPDRGLGLGRVLGLSFFALPLALLGTTQLVGMHRLLLAGWYGMLLGCGSRLLWQERRAILAYARAQRWAVWRSHLLYLLILAFGLSLQMFTTPSMQALARWTALVRSATLPPPDLFFAGSHDPLPYAAQLPFALLNKLLGIQPSTGLTLALATALALALVSLWSAVNSSLLRRPTSSHRMAIILWSGFALLLITLPGLLLHDAVWLMPWHALVRQDLDTLGLAMLTGTTLALGVDVLGGQHHRAHLVLLLPLLALVGGYGIWITAAIWLALAMLAWAGLRGDLRRWLGRCSMLLGMLVLGHGFAWSVAPPALQFTTFEITSPLLVLGLIIPIGVLVMFGAFCSVHLAGRRTRIVVASTVGSWTLLASALWWPVALLGIIPFMVCAWLATRAWLPIHGSHRWRTGAIWFQTTLASGLFMAASLMMAGRLPGDAQHLLVVATILLIFAASRSLPLLRSLIARILYIEPRALTSGALILLLLVAIFSIGSVASVRAIQPAPAQDSVATQTALEWIAAKTMGAPVLVGAPQSMTAASSSGLPALIATPDTEQRLRDVLQPSVSGVIAARLQAVSDIYSGDIGRAQQALQTYHVSYVLLGPNEQAAFPNADLALPTLVQRGVLQPAYQHGDMRIYQHMPPASMPPFVAQSVTYDLPSTKTLLLDQPVNQLPVVDEYDWNRLTAASPALGIAFWLLLIEALGLLAFPLANAVFGRWHDRGWGFSKLIGLLIWGYAVWLPVSLGAWLFNWWSLLWSTLVVAGLAALALVRQRRAGSAWIFPSRGAVLRSELCFLGAWGLWALVRAANPDLWHPIYGGEKPFEFGFLNAILRSPVLPPYDPFFSGGIINYYYYGLYLVALPIKATGIDPAVGFNLAIVTLFALTTTATLGLGRQITGRWRYGLLAVFFLVGIGPLASAFAVNESRGLAPVIEALRNGPAGFSERLGAWFWGPSRIIPYTINEFPLFSFLFADLHPHLIALPIMLLGLACAIELGQRRSSAPLLALSALVLGTLAVANSWDAPTYALLLGGVLVGRTWQRGRGYLSPIHLLLHLGIAMLVAVGVTLIGLALYTPFFLHYRAMVGGIGLVSNGDRLSDWMLWFGPLLFVIVTLLGSLSWHTLRRAVVKQRSIARAGAVALPLLLVVLLLSGWVMQDQTTGWPLRLGLALLVGVGLALLIVARLPSNTWLPLWIITVGGLVALGIQFVFIRDHLAGGSHERMNTVFKFGFQIWTLWAIGAATALPIIIRLLRRYEIALGMWLGFGIVLLLPGLLYPLVGIPSRLSTRFDPTMPLTLDGLAFMQHARYSHEDKEIDLRPDAEAIAWLKQNIKGTPVFLTSEQEFYRAYGMRIAANTGLPTVLGRLHQDEQRPPAQVAQRDHDVQMLLNTTDLETTLQLLAKYHVDYVYIGPVERALYNPGSVAKWEHLRGATLDLIYENEGVQIYRVKPEALANIAADTQPPQLEPNDVQLQALEAQAATDPRDAETAYELAERYIESGRLDDAARVLQAAAQAHPDDVPLYHLWGDVLAQLGRDDKAIRAWSHAAEVQPTPLNLNKLGQGLAQLGRWDDAERVFNDALRLDPGFVDAYFSLGELYRSRNQSGDRERAIASYQRYLQDAPADAPWRSQAEAYIAELK